MSLLAADHLVTLSLCMGHIPSHPRAVSGALLPLYRQITTNWIHQQRRGTDWTPISLDNPATVSLFYV